MLNLKKKVFVFAIIMFILTSFNIIIFSGCSLAQEDKIITEIILENTDDERIEYGFFTGFSEYKGRFNVTPDDVDAADLVLVFDNESIIEESSIETAILKDDFVYKIKAKYNGKVTMYISSKDGTCKSETKTFYFFGGTNDPSQIAKVGETATDYYYNVDFKVTNIRNAKSFSNGYVSINTSYNFLLVEIEILNNGKESFYVNPNNFVVKKYSNGNLVSTYEYDSRTYRFENAMSSYDLNYGIKKSFVILFEIDESTENGDYRIMCQGISDKSGVMIRLQQ